ncbi:hypothetical protein M5D96_010361 [Drosophila gunungcola]|uniref:Uncharacterized protein n=1 Tax=Drosophila gunungcola TaxID=103775 RepID=A0A9P9YHG4_9MUSC|nr:hypothetical protein M5D96_010361 [Drosophila gunungcola]
MLFCACGILFSATILHECLTAFRTQAHNQK